MLTGMVTNYRGSLDYWLDHFAWFDFVSINEYPILMVVWNLFLLVFPFLAAYLLKKYFFNFRSLSLFRKSQGAFLFVIWLLFFPNSAYIITDIRHISGYCPGADLTRVCVSQAWMIIFFFIYAFLGWVAFVCLLNQMRCWIKEEGGEYLNKIFPVVIIPLTSLGVLLGLLNRFNSWEIFLRPGEIIRVSGLYFSQLPFFWDWLVFTLGFYFLYYLGNYLFRKF